MFYMKNRNICKFISQIDSDKLVTHRFIYEANHSNNSNEVKLKHNRLFLVVKGEIFFSFTGEERALGVGSLVFGFKDEKFFAKGEDIGKLITSVGIKVVDNVGVIPENSEVLSRRLHLGKSL